MVTLTKLGRLQCHHHQCRGPLGRSHLQHAGAHTARRLAFGREVVVEGSCVPAAQRVADLRHVGLEGVGLQPGGCRVAAWRAWGCSAQRTSMCEKPMRNFVCRRPPPCARSCAGPGPRRRHHSPSAAARAETRRDAARSDGSSLRRMGTRGERSAPHRSSRRRSHRRRRRRRRRLGRRAVPTCLIGRSSRPSTRRTRAGCVCAAAAPPRRRAWPPRARPGSNRRDHPPAPPG
eukprot:scaffold39384_cov48-Phaeocystis_antarctica.AAC.1